MKPPVMYWGTDVKKSYLLGLIVEQLAFRTPDAKLFRIIYIVPFQIPWLHHGKFWGTRQCYLFRVIRPVDGGAVSE